MDATGIEELLADYKRLRSQPSGRKMPAMSIGGMTQRVHPYDSHEDLWQALRAENLCSGWLLFQSHQQCFDGDLPAAQPKWGRLLQAEAATRDGRSITVNRPPRTGWRMVVVEHRSTGDLLWDECLHLAYTPQWGALRYRRYWRDVPELGPVQVSACFLGFSREV